jgi:hypothetical protein
VHSQVLREIGIPCAEYMLMSVEINPATDEPDPFHLEAKPLLGSRLDAKLDLAPGPYHALPWKDMGRGDAKEPRHGSVIQRISRSGRHLPVGHNLTFRDGKNSLTKRGIPNLAWARALSRNATKQFM